MLTPLRHLPYIDQIQARGFIMMVMICADKSNALRVTGPKPEDTTPVCPAIPRPAREINRAIQDGPVPDTITIRNVSLRYRVCDAVAPETRNHVNKFHFITSRERGPGPGNPAHGIGFKFRRSKPLFLHAESPIRIFFYHPATSNASSL